jgi:cullin 3
MKQKKRMNHNQLISEVIQDLNHRFNVEINFIKASIEALIDREFIQRSDKYAHFH